MTNRSAHGAPPSRPDFGATPVAHPGVFSPPNVPNLPAGQPFVAPTFGAPEVYPWWDKQWAAAVAWNAKALNFTVTAGQVAGQSTTVTGFSYQVPSNDTAVLKAMKMTVQNPVATINLSLTLFKNQSPIQGWTGVAFDPVAATALILPFNDMNVIFQQGDVLTAAFTEASSPASNWTCSLQAYGWQITLQEIQRVQLALRY